MSFSDKLKNLPEDVQDFFCSFETRLSLEKACLLYDVKEEDMEKLTAHITAVFFKDAALNDFPLKIMQSMSVDDRIAYGIAFEMGKKMFAPFPEYFRDAAQLLGQWEKMKCAPLVSEEKARRRLLDLEPWIEEEEREKAKAEKEKVEEERKEQARLEKLPLAEALRKFSKLGEQSITGNMIKLKYFPTPVRPSIKNWLTDYQDFAGGGRHGSVERGNFLFHGENAKRLTPLERRKLTFVLRTYDEDGEVQIDPDLQTIVFETEEETPKFQAPPQMKPPAGPSYGPQFRQPVQQPAQSAPQSQFGAQTQPQVRANPSPRPSVSNFSPLAKPFPVEEAPEPQKKTFAAESQLEKRDVFKAVVQKPLQKSPDFSSPATYKAPGNLPVGPSPSEAKPAFDAKLSPVVDLKEAERKSEPRFSNMAPFGRTVNLIRPEQQSAAAQKPPIVQAPAQLRTARPPATGNPLPAEAAGKISFSSPQAFTQPKNAPLARSPYRITPRGYEYNKES